jgi:hypothetical protein
MFHKRKNMKDGRREFPRYLAVPGVLYVFSHNSFNPWWIENISKGGLAFQYTPLPGEEIETEAIEIVMSSGDQSHLASIQCKTIYDINNISANQTYSGTEKRCRGLQFVKLTKGQRGGLASLLRSSGLTAGS